VGNLNTLLRLYDFHRQICTARSVNSHHALQQLFVMNSPFIQAQADALVKAASPQPTRPTKRQLSGALYRRVLARDPSPKEIRPRPFRISREHASTIRTSFVVLQ